MNLKGSILILLFLICVIGLIGGYKYYTFTKEDPSYCSICHMMEEGYRSWRVSPHSQIVCQKCHTLDVLEANKLLIAYVMRGNVPLKQNHGRKNPWDGCIACHTQEAAQGSVTLRSSYGHARHVFMQNLRCKQCHSGKTHSFEVDQKVCQKCHKDKLVHGMGMAGLYCLNCHNYGEASPMMVTEKRCFSCHTDVPRKGVMSRIKCYECHYPHGKLRMESNDCLRSCHGNETRVGQHGLHLKRTSLVCMDCHKPHKWRIGKADAVGLCDRCHPLRDPASFIY